MIHTDGWTMASRTILRESSEGSIWKKNLAGIELEIVVGGFRGEHHFQASGAFGAGGLDLLPEGVEFLALGFDFGFV